MLFFSNGRCLLVRVFLFWLEVVGVGDGVGIVGGGGFFFWLFWLDLFMIFVSRWGIRWEFRVIVLRL